MFNPFLCGSRYTSVSSQRIILQKTASILHAGNAANLKRNNISSERKASQTHYSIGKNIREVIAKNGGTMPEKLPTPKKSLKELEKEKKTQIKLETTR